MAEKIVEVPGLGNIAFPDSMSDRAIEDAIRVHLRPGPHSPIDVAKLMTSEDPEAQIRYAREHGQMPPEGYPHHLAGQQGLEELGGAGMPALMTSPGRYLLSTGVGLGAEEASRHAGLSPGLSALVGTGAGMLTGGGLRLSPRQSMLNFIKDALHPEPMPEIGPNPVRGFKPIPPGVRFSGEPEPLPPIAPNPAPGVKPIPSGWAPPAPSQGVFNTPNPAPRIIPIEDWRAPGPVQEGTFRTPNPIKGTLPRPPAPPAEVPPVPPHPVIEGEGVPPVLSNKELDVIKNAGRAKDQAIAQYLRGRNITPEQWNSLPLDQKNVHVKAAGKFKPLGKGGVLGRSAEDASRDIFDALSGLWGR